MRNWNIYVFAVMVVIPFVYYLPMRNWNSKGSNAPKFAKTVYYLPMRNWNLFRLPKRKSRIYVYYLPMRNWNYKFLLTNEEVDGEFTIYLWGIETFNSRLIRCFIWSLLSTYEELKRGYNVSSGEVQTSLLSTYEELKLHIRAGVRLLFAGLLSTYEELKPKPTEVQN